MSGYSSGRAFNLPGPGISELVGTNGQQLRSGLAQVQLGTGICNFVFIGDSVTQRFFASTAAIGFGQRVLSVLATALGVSNPPGYFPLSTDCNYTGMTYTVAPGSLTNVDDSGFCGEASYIPPGSTATSPSINPSTGLWIHAQKGPGIGGAFTYTVNGGAAQGPVNAGAAPRQGGRIWDHGNAGGLVAGGANQVVITPDAVFGSVVEGITFFNTNHNTTRPQGFITQANANTGTGLRGWVAGHSGYFTTRFTVQGFNDPISSTPNSQARFTDPMQYINPHCVVIFLGINDINQGLSVQTYMANIKTMVALIAASASAFSYPMPTLVFVSPYGTSLDSTGAYLRYAAAMKQYCYGQGYAYFDLSSLIGNINGNTRYTGDNIHPNDTGHYTIANYLSNFLRDI